MIHFYFRGTALSRHTPLQSLTFTGQTALNPSVNNIQEDQLPNVTLDNDDESFSLPRTIEQQHEIRRPRVYFADFNKVQFIEGNKDTTQQYNLTNNNNYRHHRRRTSRKTSNKNRNNYVSPSIQQTQVLHNGSSPLSYQSNDQIGQELNIKKQPFFVSQRAHSSRLTYLPDIMNSSSVIEHSSNENFNDKYVLQREKPLIHLPKSVHDISLNSSLDITPEDKCNDVTRSSPTQDTHDRTHECELSDYNSGTLAHGISSVSSTSNNRQRALLRKISLRQQFNSSIKIKATGIGISTNNTHLHHHQQRQQITYTKLNLYQSTSNKHSISRMHDNNDDFNSNGRLLTIENRPMTGPGSVKNFKHSDIIHFTSKSPLRGNTINDTNEISRYFNRSRSQESTHERFENVLTVVRPPYASVMGTTTSATPNDLTEQTMYHNQTKRNLRSSHETLAFHVTSNTITV